MSQPCEGGPGRPDSPGARLILAEALWGWRPHSGQREWLLDVSRVKVAACGRRWGKTESESVDAASYAITHPGSQQMIVAPTYDQARLIANGVERLLLGSTATRRSTEVRKTPYPSISVFGSRISARSADDDGRSLRGHRADRVIVDEAAFVRDAVISDVVQPMLADTDGQLIMISTPFGRNHFWRAWAAGQEPGGRVRSFRFPSSANPFISQAYIESQRLEVPDRSFRAEYLAEFIDDASRVFARSDIEACAALGRQDAPAAPPRLVAGIDWARYTDYTVIIALDLARRPWRLAALDRYQCRSWESSIERAAEFLRNWKIAAALPDSTGVGDPLNEQLRMRLERPREAWCEVGDFVFGVLSKAALVDNLVMRIAHRDIALAPVPGLEGLVREMEEFEYELRTGGGVSYGAPSGAHDDCVMALALAAWQGRSAPEGRIRVSSGLASHPVIPDSIRDPLRMDAESSSARRGSGLLTDEEGSRIAFKGSGAAEAFAARRG